MSIKIERIARGFMLLHAPFTQDNFKKMQEIPGYSKWQGRALKFRPVASTVQYIYDNWPEATWEGDAKDVIVSHLKDVNQALQIRAKKKIKLEDDGEFEYKTKPYDHQLQGFLLSKDMNYFALLMEMGTGKTKILIDTFAYLYSKAKIDCVVVIAPNGVHRNWVEIEMPVHLPEWCAHKADFYSSKHGKKRMSKIYDILLGKNYLPIITINIESLQRSTKARSFLENIIDSKKCMVILDESTTIKSHDSKQSKFVYSACKHVPYKRIANGAPITKGIEDLYAQFRFLNPNILGYDTYTSFKAQYCEEITRTINEGSKNERKFKTIVDYKNIDELIEKMDSYSLRVLKKDCLDLPEKVYKKWVVELSPQQKKAYTELKLEYMTQIENSWIEEELPIVRLLRLQQITCGWYPGEDGKMLPIPGGNPRLDALEQITNEVVENDEKAIIWARFKQDIYAIEKMLGDKAVSYHGDIKEDERIRNVKRFQNDDSVRFMIAMLSSKSSAVRGHTWTAASVCIYYSNIFDLDPRMQSEDRMHRIGVGDKTLYIDLMAIGTNDKKIINALLAKKSIADMVTQDGPSGFLDFINS